MRRAFRLFLMGVIFLSCLVLLVSVLHPGLRRAHLLRLRAEPELMVGGQRIWAEPSLLIENAPIAPGLGSIPAASPGHFKLLMHVALRSLAPLPAPEAVTADSVWLFWGPVVFARELHYFHDYREDSLYTSIWVPEGALPHLDRMPRPDVLVSVREGEKRHLLIVRRVKVYVSG